MNLSRANTEAFYKIHRFHEHLNRTIKTSAIGLCLLENALNQGIKSEEINKISYGVGGLWGGMPDWTAPKDLVREARWDLGRNGVMRVFSAFDLFMDHLSADTTGWNDFQRKVGLRNGAGIAHSSNIKDTVKVDTDDDRCLKMYTSFRWSRDTINFLLPLYQYYRTARNCIAHRSGLSSEGLEEISNSPELEVSLREWGKVTGEENAPPIDKVRADQQINLNHKDAILVSSIIRRISQDMNDKTVPIFGAEGMVYLSAKVALFAEPPLVWADRPRAIIGVLHHALSTRYRVTDLTVEETDRIIKTLEIRARCESRFNSLYKTS